jgi:hypothetical protein
MDPRGPAFSADSDRCDLPEHLGSVGGRHPDGASAVDPGEPSTMLGRFRIGGVCWGSLVSSGTAFAWVAQSVEQRTRNAQVRSSNLLSGSKSGVTSVPALRPNVQPFHPQDVSPLGSDRGAVEWGILQAEHLPVGAAGECSRRLNTAAR